MKHFKGVVRVASLVKLALVISLLAAVVGCDSPTQPVAVSKTVNITIGVAVGQ